MHKDYSRLIHEYCTIGYMGNKERVVLKWDWKIKTQYKEIDFATLNKN